MSARPSFKPPATAVAASPRSAAAPRTTGLSSARALPTRRLRCSASAAAAIASAEMADAPLDWAGRSLEELRSLPDHDTFCLMALSPLDGRYDRFVKELMPFFSEFGLIRYRVLIEIKWLLKLSQIPEITEVPQFSKEAQAFLNAIIDNFCIDDAKEVKKIEKVTNHDVKAVEYFLKQRCSSNPEIAKVSEFFHFGCTSEDINNLSHALALKEGVNRVMFPAMIDICRALCSLATQNSGYPMLARTHGQPASPTTVGKEMANFAARLSDIGKSFSEVKILGKFAGAVGNYNADVVAYPEVDWPKVAEEFVRSLGLQFNPYVTQIEPHDYISKLFNLFTQFNNVLTDFDRDMWSYISLGYFKQIPKAGEVGSSTMPHKINPIDFENSDGNLCQANSILSGISMKLPISRMQILADGVIPNEYGINPKQKLKIGSKIARRLLGKILIDLRNTREEAISVAEPKFIEDEAQFLPTKEAEHQQKIQVRNEDGRRSSSTSEKSLDQEDEDDRETKYRLDPKYANVRTPERHVRTRLYFTSESHIHSLMNVLRYCNLDESLQGEESLVCQSALDRLHRTRELDYMSNIVLRMFENTEVPLEDEKRFRIEMTFSRGADLSPLEDKTSESSLLQEHTLPIMGPERLQEVGSCLTMDKFEKMVRPFAMPPEDFPPAAPPQALGYFSKGAGGVLERLVSLWPFHKSTNAANGKLLKATNS